MVDFSIVAGYLKFSISGKVLAEYKVRSKIYRSIYREAFCSFTPVV